MKEITNGTIEQSGNILTITLRLDGPSKISASGKSRVFASTNGNITVGEIGGREIKLGLNCYTKA